MKNLCHILKGVTARILIVAFMAQISGASLLQAQEFAVLKPVPVVSQLPALKGISVVPSDGLKLEFLFDPHEQVPGSDAINKLVRLFLSGLTVNAKDIWVNLSPYEKGRIMPDILFPTELGEILAQQDYLLKWKAASLTNPNTPSGKLFWQECLRHGIKAGQNSFTKVWIVPSLAEVHNDGTTAFLGGLHLKVMLQEDYLAMTKHQTPQSSLNKAQEIEKSVLLPVLEKDVNEGKDFEPIREVFRVLVLACWFKKFQSIKINTLGYIDSFKMLGLDIMNPENITSVFDRYVDLYRKGAYNFIREDHDQGKMVARKYFSGGILSMNPAMIHYDRAMSGFSKAAMILALVAFAGVVAASPVHAAKTQVASETVLVTLEAGDTPLKVFQDLYKERVKKDVTQLEFSSAVKAGDISVVSADGQKERLYHEGDKIADGEQLKIVLHLTTGAKPPESEAEALFRALQGGEINLAAVRPKAVTPSKINVAPVLSFGAPANLISPSSPWTYAVNGTVFYPAGTAIDARFGYSFNDLPKSLWEYPITAYAGIYSQIDTTNLNPMNMFYTGLHTPINNDGWHTYLEYALDPTLPGIQPTYRVGIGSSPTYDKGFNYIWDISGIVFPNTNPNRYVHDNLGVYFNGYASAPWAEIFKDKKLKSAGYISFLPRVYVGNYGVAVNGTVRLNIFEKYDVFAGGSWFSSPQDLSYLQMASMQYDWQYSKMMGIAVRPWEDKPWLKLAATLGRTFSDGGKPATEFRLGLNFRFGTDEHPLMRPIYSIPVDFLNDRAMTTELNKRQMLFLLSLTLAMPSVLIGTSESQAASSSRFTAVLSTTKRPGICGVDPQVRLKVGDPFDIRHLVYMSFMYWYFKLDDQQIKFSTDQKLLGEFTNMSLKDWFNFFREQKVTEKHFRFVSLIQARMTAEAAGICVINDHEIFSGDFRDLMDRWITYLEEKMGFGYFEPRGNIAMILLEQFVKKDLTISDFARVLPEVIVKGWPRERKTIYALQKKYDVPLKEGEEGWWTDALVDAISREILKSDKAQVSPVDNGGIDFGNLPVVLSWQGLSHQDRSNPILKNLRIIGMAFKVLKITMPPMTKNFLRMI